MNGVWLHLTELGFVGFIAALCGLIWRGCNRDGVWQPSAWAWLISAALFFLLWLVSLPRVPRP